MVYLPSSSGVQRKLYEPSMLLVVVPMWTKLPSGVVASKLTVTPVALVGIGCCMCRYSIHALMLSSEIAGVPACAGDKSRTVPFMSVLLPFVMTSFCTATVVDVEPFAKAYSIPWVDSCARRVPYTTADGL